MIRIKSVSVRETGVWVRRSTPSRHVCDPPTRVARYEFPSAALATGGTPTTHEETIPDGKLGDLWRCACGKLWRIGYACDLCDQWPPSNGTHGNWGHPTYGRRWRPATLWQRLIHR